MKRYISGILCVIGISFFALAPAFATPPSEIILKYDTARGELDVMVQHNTTKTKEHFIKEVIVMKNGAEVAKKDFTFQMSHRNQTMIPFKISAKEGDVFKVKAFCNKSGQGEAELSVHK